MLRHLCATALLSAATFPAMAGGSDCGGNCYRPVWVPAQYGAIVERVPVRAPRPMALLTPPEYTTVTQRVVVRPARHEWRVTRDAYGRPIGCWVDTPAEYATVSRRVQVRAPSLIPYAQPAAYGLAGGPVLVAPAHREWAPLGDE